MTRPFPYQVVLALLLTLWQMSLAQGSTIHVGPGRAVSSITAAIASANACDTVMVHSGSYSEGTIVVQKPIFLIGVGLPVIDGQYKYELIIIAAKQVTLEGFVLKNSGRSNTEDWAGVKCLDAHYVNIRGNRLDSTFFGIHLSNTDYANIEHNTLSAHAQNEYELGNGIHLWKCAYASITDNYISGHRDGIYFEFVTGSSVRRNISQGNKRYGLHFMFSHDDDYYDNEFRNNGAGVAVMYTRHVKMYRNKFDQNWGASAYGMLLKDISDSEIFNNEFTGNTVGIYMEGVSRTLLNQNLFRQNGWAVRLQANCDDNSFERNNFIANSFDIATNGSLVLNTVDGNFWDKYQGYDLDRDGLGDVPYHPISLFSTLTEQVPSAIILWRSFLVLLIDSAERATPVLTPKNMKDNQPNMYPHDLH